MTQNFKEAYNKRWRKKEEICKRFRESSYRKENGKYKVYLKDIEVGEYTKTDTPRQFRSFNEIQPGSTDKRFIDAEVRNTTPINKIKLIYGLSNWCICGKTRLIKKEYIKHTKSIHEGMALKLGLLNRPPWVDWIFIYSDEAEAYYSGLDMDMDT